VINNNKTQPDQEINAIDYPRLLKRYAQLLEVTSNLPSALEIDIVLDQIVTAVCELTESQAASILLFDAQSNQLYFHSATNFIIDEMERTVVPTEKSIAGWIFTQKKSIIVDDVPNDPRFFPVVDVLSNFSTTSIAGVPLRTKEVTLGVIEAVNKLEGKFDQEDIRLIEALAAQAAIAIENRRLFYQSDLVAEMVHELRTPLTAVTAAANLLQRSDVSDEQRQKLARIVYDEVQRLNGMTTNFLELSRLETGRVRFQREPVHLGGLVEECLELVRLQTMAEGIQLETELDRTIIPVQGDRNKLKQVVLNLLSNAMKYNRQGGKIRIELKRADQHALLEVSDTGKEIPAEALPQIFDRFYRVPDSQGLVAGTGLGLAIAKRIVENHEGQIEVESTVGEGSTFKVYLPIISSLRRDTRPLI
jgi:signal transduction histidine kinase